MLLHTYDDQGSTGVYTHPVDQIDNVLPSDNVGLLNGRTVKGYIFNLTYFRDDMGDVAIHPNKWIALWSNSAFLDGGTRHVLQLQFTFADYTTRNVVSSVFKEYTLDQITKYITGHGVDTGTIDDHLLVDDDPTRPIPATAQNTNHVLLRGNHLYVNEPTHFTAQVVGFRDFATSDLPNGYTWGGVHQITPSAVATGDNTVIFSTAAYRFERKITAGPGAVWINYNMPNWLGVKNSQAQANSAASAIGQVVFFGGTVHVVDTITPSEPDRFDWFLYEEVLNRKTADLEAQADGSTEFSGALNDSVTRQFGVPPAYELDGTTGAAVWDVDESTFAELNLDKNHTLNLTGGVNGTVAFLRINQDAHGNHTLTLDKSIETGPRHAPRITKYGNNTDLLMFHRLGAVWYYLGINYVTSEIPFTFDQFTLPVGRHEFMDLPAARYSSDKTGSIPFVKWSWGSRTDAPEFDDDFSGSANTRVLWDLTLTRRSSTNMDMQIFIEDGQGAATHSGPNNLLASFKARGLVELRLSTGERLTVNMADTVQPNDPYVWNIPASKIPQFETLWNALAATGETAQLILTLPPAE